MRALLLGCSMAAAACTGSTKTKPAVGASNDATAWRLDMSRNDVTAWLLDMSPECPRPAAEAPPEPQGPLRVFVEMFVVDADAERLRAAGPVDALLSDPTTKIASMHVLANDGVRSDILEAHVTPRIDAASSRVTLDFVTDAPAVKTTLLVADGQRVVLGAEAHDGRTRTAMLVPTIVRSESDLRRIFECKKESARLARRGSKSQE